MPYDFDVLVAYGECAGRCGEIDAASDAFHRAVKVQPQSCRALNGLGALNQFAGRVRDAITCFEKVLAIDPNFQAAYLNLAVALRESKRPVEALTCLDRALNRWPGFAGAAELRRQIVQEAAERV
jgi:tetratricopeptide (TPR) repeat protein